MHGRDLRHRRTGRGGASPQPCVSSTTTPSSRSPAVPTDSAPSGCHCPGILSVVAAIGATVAAFASGHAHAGIPAAAGLAFLLVWLVLFNRVALPINKTLIAASYAGETPSDARALQDRWESIINLRSVLQGLALLAFCLAIALA